MAAAALDRVGGRFADADRGDHHEVEAPSGIRIGRIRA
jgi:hypothetical protein